MSNQKHKPVVLVILDGWGEQPAGETNAITLAETPVWDRLSTTYPKGIINASELHVGLPTGQMGNSEVGHMNIGSGRVVLQDLPRIDKSIADNTLASEPKLVAFIDALKKSGGTCHLMGLVSPGGVHAHQKHIAALAKAVAAAGVPVAIHAFLDGRDTPPQSAIDYVAELQKDISGLNNTAIATLAGRYYAMDRDKRWDRVEKAWRALALAEGNKADLPEKAILASYEDGKNDEFVLPVVLGDYAGMKDGDGVLMANFRADRAREISTALLDKKFDGFARTKDIRFAAALGMVEYSSEINAFMETLFPPESLTDILGEVVSGAGLKQLRIAETEKYAHVTFFFNGGREQEFAGEERILIPSPKVATYDLKPEMSAPEVTEKLVEAIAADRFDLIVVNYANTDMVGHTGNVAAATKAVEAVDTCLGKVVDATLAKGGALFITADHGNAEMMFDPKTGQAHTAHTLNLVPAIIVAKEYENVKLKLHEGRLADVAPTILRLLNLSQPAAMTGTSLLPAAS